MLNLRTSIEIESKKAPLHFPYGDRGISKNATKPEFIPANVGVGPYRTYIQRRTLIYWSSLAVLGVAGFQQVDLSPKIRAALLAIVFPGAGYLASCNWTGFLCLLLTYALMPFALIAWFGAGGILFPGLLWVLGVPGAYFATGEKSFRYAGILTGTLLASFFAYWHRRSAIARAACEAKRQTRNAYLSSELSAIDSSVVPAPPDADRELSLDELRDVQYVIDQALKAEDDWEGFTIIDQFQPAALRYQLYEMLYDLGLYQGVYTPNCHAYVSLASRMTIEKCLVPKVMSYWRLETLWGKFSTDFDPIKEDNIMVTGFFLQACMLYTANTGDLKYAKPGSLKFRVTESKTYDHDIHSMSESLVRQWKENPYCLFPCEPNWIYTNCNFQGATGQAVYDRFFGTDHFQKIAPAFEESVNTEFTELDGSVLPIRSEHTGFTIPNVLGALSDLANAILSRPCIDHMGRRLWAFFRRECITFDADGKLKLVGLVGADHIDPGNYTKSDLAIYPILAHVAGDFGDERVRQAAVALADEGYGKVTTATGATTLDRSKISGMIGGMYLRGRITRNDDWKNLILKGPSKKTLAGPILSEVPYPGVLVAKARSHDSSDLDLVLYPSADDGIFPISISRLQPNRSYYYGDKKAVMSSASGELTLEIRVSGRTRIHLVPA